VKNPAGHVTPKLDTYVRTDMRTTEELRLGLWLRYQDKDLSTGGHNQCYEVPTDTNENGEPVPCFGRQITTIARVQYRPEARLSGLLMVEHQFVDDAPKYMDRFRQDIAIWLIGLYKPNKDLRFRARLRYYDEGIDDNTYLERSLSALFDVAAVVRDRDTLRVRLDTKFWLDDRASTLVREPNPELAAWLWYELRL